LGNRTPRHQRAGQKNLKGKLTLDDCPCCDPIQNHKPKIIAKIHADEVREATEQQSYEKRHG